jgi:tRNA-dihydrouridine synthase A
MRPYVEAELAAGTPLGQISRHILGLYRNQPGGRAFRRHLSEHAHRKGAGWAVIEDALALTGQRAENNDKAAEFALS